VYVWLEKVALDKVKFVAEVWSLGLARRQRDDDVEVPDILFLKAA